MNENERKRSHIFDLLQNARDYISDNFEDSQEKKLALIKLDGALLWVEAYEHTRLSIEPDGSGTRLDYTRLF